MFQNDNLFHFRDDSNFFIIDKRFNFSDIKNLEEDIFVYAKKNLAVVNVYIKDPVVTRIMRDQEYILRFQIYGPKPASFSLFSSFSQYGKYCTIDYK